MPYRSLRWPLRAVGGVLNARASHPGRYHHPALIVSITGDPAAPYPGWLVMHRAQHGSRLVTLTQAFRHGLFPMAGS